MKIIWFVYGDIFASHPNLTIGDAVNGVPTPIDWNTPSEAGGEHWCPTANPLGMTTTPADGLTTAWDDKRVLDFGDNNGWQNDKDIYIDDADTPLAQNENINVTVYSNTGRTRTMTLDYLQAAGMPAVRWFSDNSNHGFYSAGYSGSTSALDLANMLNPSQAFIDNYASRHSVNHPDGWTDFVIFKVRFTTTTSNASSTFISNTTGAGQTIAQRFNTATLYDATDANHVAAQRIDANPHPSIQAGGDGRTGFMLAGVDVANPYVNGVNIIACVQNPVRNAFTKTAGTGLTAVSLDDVYGEADASTTLTGFRSMNWTNYGTMSDGTGYTNQRQDVVNYYNNNGNWTMPDGNDSQTCPAPQNGTNEPVNNRYKLHTWMMLHAENAGYTADGTVRNFGSDLNMIIPNPPIAGPNLTIADRLNNIPPGTLSDGEVVLVGPFAAVNETTYTRSAAGDWWDVTGFNTGVDRVQFRDNNGTTQVSYTGPNQGPTEGGWYDVSFDQRPGFGTNADRTVVMESLYMPNHTAAWYSTTAIDAALAG